MAARMDAEGDWYSFLGALMGKTKTILTWLAAVLALLSVPAALLSWGFLLPAQYEETFMGELKYKVRYLEEAPGPRIVLVGGSGVAFGADSALMERELPGYTVVNFGMYAALGTTVMLDLSQELIRPGDIVVLIPEQQEQTLSGFFDPAVMWQGADGAWELLRALPREALGRMAGQFPRFAADKCAAVLRGRPPQGAGVYRRDSFNAAGDVVSPLCRRNVMEGGFDPNTPIRFEPELLSEEFVRRVRAYARAVEEQGGALWYAFGPMNAAAVEGAAGPDGFFDAVQSRLGVPVIGDPNASVLDAGWFYDTNFHLNTSGKTVYTRLLIRNIKAMLGDSSPTDIAIPAQPEPEQAEVWAGDDSDAGCFVLEDRGGWAAVTGLTPEGADRERLVAPSAWEGLPVAAIDAAAFASGERLRELVIQQNIHAIADGAFDGAPALERVVMRSGRPADCRVGQGLLKGTDAAVYVPAQALSRYRADYFWAVHAQRILPEGG